MIRVWRLPPEEIVWEPATLRRAVEIMGFNPGDDPNLNQPDDAQTAAVCEPCFAGPAPPSNCGSPGGLAREAFAVAVNCCCDAAFCPPSCDDNNACTRDYCKTGCGTAYCAHDPRVCNDGSLCTDDSCDPSTGCVYQPKNCDDGVPCTRDQCFPDTGCRNNLHCDPRQCCPDGTSYFCCDTTEEDICCPTNPAYADHCCSPERPTCCGGGCCLPAETCCNGVCGTKGACCKFETGSCSEETSLCCLQQGGSYLGDGTTCSPADKCRPVCENCHAVSADSYECAHFTEDPTEPCSTTQCIVNMVNTVSCDSFPHRLGQSKCDTKVLTNGTFEIQELRQLVSGSCPTFSPGGYHLWMNLYSGCVPPCNVTPINNRCDTLVCEGTLVQTALRTPGRACGCP